MTAKNKRPYPRFAQNFSGESKTQQHFRDQVDVNNIVAQYDRTGIDPYADRKAQERYGDGMYRTFKDALDTVADFESQFAELPWQIREQYNNDTQTYLAAVQEQISSPDDPQPEPPAEAPREPLDPPPEDTD